MNRFSTLILTLLALTTASCQLAAASAVDTTPWKAHLVLPETPVDVLKAEVTDLECLTLNIYHESRGDTQSGKEWAAQLVLDRVANPEYPGKMEVDFQTGQETPTQVCEVVREIRYSAKTGRPVAHFSWTLDGKSDQAKETEAYRDSYALAIEFLIMGKRVDSEYAGRLTNYHHVDIDPGWDDLTYVATVGAHKFYVKETADKWWDRSVPIWRPGQDPGQFGHPRNRPG